LLAEQDLAAKIGQLLGVQLILTGSITQFSIERTSGGFRSFGPSVSRAAPGACGVQAPTVFFCRPTPVGRRS